MILTPSNKSKSPSVSSPKSAAPTKSKTVATSVRNPKNKTKNSKHVLDTDDITTQTPTFLGSGTYGCVFNPPLKCSDPKKSKLTLNPRNVGKVYFRVQDFEDERDIMKKVSKEVDPEGIFTVKFSGDCHISKPPPEVLATASEGCKRLQGNEYQIMYPDGGSDLKQFYNKYREKPRKFFDLFKAMKPIFAGLSVLDKKKLIHNDIKPANMLYNPKLKKITLIDYGMMSTYKDIFRHYSGTNDAFYMYYPPEYRIINNIVQTNECTSVSSVMRFYTKSFEPVDPAEFFAAFGIDLKRDASNLIRVYNYSLKRQRGGDVNNKPEANTISPHTTPRRTMRTPKSVSMLFDQALDKIDVYSLGISIAYIIRSMGLVDPLVVAKLSIMERMQLSIIKQLIYHMIRPNVFERWDVKTVLAYVNTHCFP